MSTASSRQWYRVPAQYHLSPYSYLLHLSTGREGLAHLPYKLSKVRRFKGKAVSQVEQQTNAH